MSIALALPVRAQTPSVPDTGRDLVLAVVRAFHDLARRDLWPGFEPDTIPLAIFDGTRTWLFGHSSPPADFPAERTGTDVLVMRGRYAQLTANSTAAIGGRTTATVLMTGSEDPLKVAAVAIHETFHAFQRTRHPTWIANEASLFTYPWENVDALAGRRAEFRALRLALSTPDRQTQLCQATLAIAARARRFALLGTDAVAYEVRNELNEGLAQYVEDRASGRSATNGMPVTEFPPDRVRDRVYATGSAIGQLLDRFDPSWREGLEHADTTTTLDGLLKALVQGDPPVRCTAGVSTDRETARRDIEALKAQLAETLRRYVEQPGYSVVVDASARVLNVGGFDPLNVARVTATQVLHRRYLKLEAAGGELEVIGHAALTDGASGHPLFAGVRRVTVAGLGAAPTVRVAGDTIEISDGNAFHLKFHGARLQPDAHRLTVTLPP